MNRPEMLRAITVGDVRKEIRDNLKSLVWIGQMMSNGFLDEARGDLETYLNRVMTEYVIQQEYLREREAANWGWSKDVVDFSK